MDASKTVKSFRMRVTIRRNGRIITDEFTRVGFDPDDVIGNLFDTQVPAEYRDSTFVEMCRELSPAEVDRFYEEDYDRANGNPHEDGQFYEDDGDMGEWVG